MKDLSSLTRAWTCVPCIARQILNHWTIREVPRYRFLIILTQSWDPPCRSVADLQNHSLNYTFNVGGNDVFWRTYMTFFFPEDLKISHLMGSHIWKHPSYHTVYYLPGLELQNQNTTKNIFSILTSALVLITEITVSPFPQTCTTVTLNFSSRQLGELQLGGPWSRCSRVTLLGGNLNRKDGKRKGRTRTANQRMHFPTVPC